MTESEWLACEDSQMMLSFAQGEDFHQHRLYPLSDRKLRLFACACCYGVSAELGKDAEQCTEWESGPAKNAANWATAWVGDQKQPTSAERANLLRDIVGNPFRPVALPCNTGCKMMTSGRGDKPHHCHTHHKDVEYVGHDKRTRFAVCPDSLEYFRWKYCTPTVLAIAQAAYEERPGRKCKCGDGFVGGLADDDEYACARCGRAAGLYGHYSERSKQMECPKCPTCNGTGRIDGSLDPVTLAILADALEEAGMPQEEECDLCNGDGFIDASMTGPLMKCGKCSETGKLPTPLLAHLRSGKVHVRGCWALDLILGKE